MRKVLMVLISFSAIAIGQENWQDKALIKLVERYYELSQKVSELEKRIESLEEKAIKEKQRQKKETIKPKLIANKNTYIRACPSSKCKPLVLVKAKEVVELLEARKNWYKVRNDLGVEGWVFAKSFSEFSY
ncbi:MAG: SH3 domain-containing protein [Archaeoglobaceae archaeon]